MRKKKHFNKTKKKKEKVKPQAKATPKQKRQAAKSNSGALKLYTIDNVAAALSVSKPTVERMLARGVLPYYKIGNLTRIRSEDLENFLTERLVINGKEEI